MSNQPKILAFADSSRIASFNKKLVKFAVEGAKKARAELGIWICLISQAISCTIREAGRDIRAIMEAEAQRQGLNLTKSQLAELQPLVGRNPMLARKVIRNEKLGIKQGIY